MEDIRIIKKFLYIALGGALFVLPFFVFAYEPRTTHRALTQEMITVFNFYNSQKQLNDGDKNQIIQGSFDEDAGIRSVHHFYDPVHDTGILGRLDAKRWSQDTLAQATSHSIGETMLYGSIYTLFSSGHDFSWDRAVYDYAWGDKKRGLEKFLLLAKK